MARKLAQGIYGYNPSYILPNQILAYSYFLEGNWDKAQTYLKQLLKLDEDGIGFYNLLLGISKFYQQKRPEAINYLRLASDHDLALYYELPALIRDGQIKEALQKYYTFAVNQKALPQAHYRELFASLFLKKWGFEPKELSLEEEILLSKIVKQCKQSAQERSICYL